MLVTAVLCGVSAQAETVESISYNPSRLGVFSYLKVQDNAILRGGVTTPYLNINTRNASLEGANKIQTGAVTISNTADLTNAELSDSVTHDNYAYTQTPTNVAGTVTMNGGKAEVSEDSFINNLNNVGKVKLKAHNTIYAPGVKIQGNSASVGLVDGSSKGWQLGKYEIPLPTQVADGADYEYIWQEMQFKDKKATVLTLQKPGQQGCTSDEDDVDRCEHAEGTWDYNNCTCICPQGTFWDVSQGWCEPTCDPQYKLYNEQDCVTGGHKSYDWLPGTWSDELCDCVCPQGTQFMDQEGCVKGCFDPNDPAYAQDMDYCSHGGYFQGHVPGIWNPTTCECMCLSGSYSSGPGSCELRDGWDEQDFYEEHDDCFGGNDSNCNWYDDNWDAYDEGYYDDYYDDYWDYDYDYDYDYW